MTFWDEITAFANEPDPETGEVMDPKSEAHRVFCTIAHKGRSGLITEFLAREFLEEKYDYPNVKNPKVKASDF